jgi:PPOX class probable F420-dependent enzyme
MTVEFTQEVSDRLSSDKYGWLTTVAKSGQPVPRLVWFYFDTTDVIVYSEPNAAKVRHIRAHPRVSFIIGGVTSVDAEGADPLADERYLAKSTSTRPALDSARSSSTAYSTRLKIAIDKVWTTPTGG